MRKTLMVLLLSASAIALTVPTCARAQLQALSPYQQQVLLRGVKRLLTDKIETARHDFNTYGPIVAKTLYQIQRIEVLEEVLQNWTDTPDYARYALNVLEWQGQLSIAIADMADAYVLQHGHLDPRFKHGTPPPDGHRSGVPTSAGIPASPSIGRSLK
jgi:hypothetical protein